MEISDRSRVARKQIRDAIAIVNSTHPTKYPPNPSESRVCIEPMSGIKSAGKCFSEIL